MEKIKIGIVGYGNLGKGVMQGIKQNEDLELIAVFSRREPNSFETIYPIKKEKIENLVNYIGKIDVMILCGGSATDLPNQAPEILKMFNTVDSFDTHAKIPEHFSKMNKIGKEFNHLGALSIGWDPGLFSIIRCLFNSFLPVGETYTFWGKGVSQGHSDAIRRIDGVENAIQYTIPVEKALKSVRNCENPKLTTREKHIRECFVVLKTGANKEKIEKEIIEMPNYFIDYDTTVHFISNEELKKNHSKMSHGGFVLRSGKSYSEDDMLLELAIKLGSNPSFTSLVLISFARAVYRMNKNGFTGAITVLDTPLKYLSSEIYEDLLKTIL